MISLLRQASVALTYTATPFTLANFTDSLILVATNVNGTNAVPEGAPQCRVPAPLKAGLLSCLSALHTPGLPMLTRETPPRIQLGRVSTHICRAAACLIETIQQWQYAEHRCVGISGCPAR